MTTATSTLTSFIRKVAISLIGLALFLAIQPAARASQLTCVGVQNCVYAIDDASLEFGTLILTTGVFTGIPGSSPGSVSSGLAEQGGNLYTGQYHGNTLYQVNLDGSITKIGTGSISSGGGYRCTGATTSGLYGFDTEFNLYSVSIANGATTMIGSLMISGNDLGCSANGTALYATLDDGSCSILYLINTTSPASATKIGCIEASGSAVRDVNDLVFQNGVLYGNDRSGNLWIISTANAQGTLVTNNGLVFSGLALPASTYAKLHDFSGGSDGAYPYSGLTWDKAGNLYGTANAGANGYGTVYKLVHKGTGWTVSPLYNFAGGNDGAGPLAGVIFGADGTLYGTTEGGGGGTCNLQGGCGTVFNLKPPPRACTTTICFWKETILYSFMGPRDGAFPYLGDLTFDQHGNLYGTTQLGGEYGNCIAGYGCGTVYELTPSGPPWMKTVLWNFGQVPNDGAAPASGVIFDQHGNLYGTTVSGFVSDGCGIFNPGGCGTVYELIPGSPWTESILKQSFQPFSEGAASYAGVTFDSSGNVYSTTTADGLNGGGTVFELAANNNWTFDLLYSLTGGNGGTGQCDNCSGPYGTLIMDAAGDLYGTTLADGAFSKGSVFELTPSNGGWIYTDLYDFCSQASCTDGAYPYSSLVFDASGNLYGTASAGGTNNKGVVFEITPNN